jgi:hypothetical protein
MEGRAPSHHYSEKGSTSVDNNIVVIIEQQTGLYPQKVLSPSTFSPAEDGSQIRVACVHKTPILCGPRAKIA